MGWYFEYLWRLFGTALSFAIFGIGGLVYGLVIFPLLFVFVRDRDSRRIVARRLIGRGFGAFWKMMYILGLIDYRIQGREHIDDRRRQLIIANHPTLIDVVVLISLFPQANCVIKEAVTKNPFMGSTVRAADYISNSEPEDLLESCAASMRSGSSLLLFPEGTRTGHNQPIDFRPGAATVAVRTGADILPIAIRCDPPFLSRQHPWHHVPRKRPTFTIRILPPIPVRELVSRSSDERQLRQDVNEAMLAMIRRELDYMEFSEDPN